MLLFVKATKKILNDGSKGMGKMIRLSFHRNIYSSNK